MFGVAWAAFLFKRENLSREVVSMATNWTIIKNEYINGGCTYRSLAEKYGVSSSMVEKKAQAENWRALKMKQLGKIEEKLKEKTAEKIAESESEVVAIMARIRLNLTRKIEQAVDRLEDVDAGELRKLVQSYKDMSEAQIGTEEEKTGVLNEILDAVRGVEND